MRALLPPFYTGPKMLHSIAMDDAEAEATNVRLVLFESR